MTMIDDGPDPFEGACSCGAIFAVVYAELGPDSLRELLDGLLAGKKYPEMDEEPTIPDKESLEKDAGELRAIGLPQVAAIVSEAAARAVPGHMLRRPYSLQHNSYGSPVLHRFNCEAIGDKLGSIKNL
jgi:hypothetical protein